MKRSIFCFLAAPLLAIGLIIWLYGFGGYDQMLYGPHYIEAQQASWQQRVAIELPIGSTEPQIRQWATNQSLTIYQTPDKKMIEIAVRTIPWHQVVCKEWSIVAEFTMQNEKSVEEKVASMGACL